MALEDHVGMGRKACVEEIVATSIQSERERARWLEVNSSLVSGWMNFVDLATYR